MHKMKSNFIIIELRRLDLLSLDLEFPTIWDFDEDLASSPLLHQARERSAVDLQVLSGDVTRLNATQKSAGVAKLLRGPKSLCGNGGFDFFSCCREVNAFEGHHSLGELLLTRGVNSFGQKIIDGDIVLGNIKRQGL